MPSERASVVSSSRLSSRPASLPARVRARSIWRRIELPLAGAYSQPGSMSGTASDPPRTASTWVARKWLAAAAIAACHAPRLCVSSTARLSLVPGRSGRMESMPAASRRRITSTVKRRIRFASSNRAGTISSLCWRPLSNARAYSSELAPPGSGQGQPIGVTIPRAWPRQRRAGHHRFRASRRRCRHPRSRCRAGLPSR